MNEEEKIYIKQYVLRLENRDTHFDLLVRDVLKKYPHLEDKVVRDHMFMVLFGAA